MAQKHEHHNSNNGRGFRSTNNDHQQHFLRTWKLSLTILALFSIIFVYHLITTNTYHDDHHADGGVEIGILDICQKAYGPVRQSSTTFTRTEHVQQPPVAAFTTEIFLPKMDNRGGDGTVATEQTPSLGAQDQAPPSLQRLRDQGQQDELAEEEQQQRTTFIHRPKTRKLLFKGATLFLILSYVSLIVFHLKSSSRAIYLTLFTVSWYHISWGFLLFLKQYLNDSRCNIHPNSISGHFHYFVFSMLTLPFLFTFLSHEQQKELVVHGAHSQHGTTSNGIVRTVDRFCQHRELVFYGIYGILFLLSVLCMNETYSDGYHSLRQIIYGSALAIVSHVLFIYVLTHIYSPNDKVRSAIVLALLFVVMIVCNSVTGTVSKVLLFNVVGLGLTALAVRFS